jgi:hypothetical protein
MNDPHHFEPTYDRRHGAHPAGRARSRLDRPAPTDAPPAFDHGAVSRFNAWFFHTFDRYINYIARRHKQAAFTDISADVVVEVGAGIGANLDYLPGGIRLIAIDPAMQMHDRLRERAAQAGLDLELLAHGAETLPRRWLQRAIRRPWAWLLEGCQVDRDTTARVRAAGFSDVRIQSERFHRSFFVPVNTTIWATR